MKSLVSEWVELLVPFRIMSTAQRESECITTGALAPVIGVAESSWANKELSLRQI